jgi:ABC-type glycerol-3-phosphate transport system substrate-binding protein
MISQVKKISPLFVVFLLLSAVLFAGGTQETGEAKAMLINMWSEVGYWEGYFIETTQMYTTEHPNVKFNVIPQENMTIYNGLRNAYQSGAEDLDLSYAWVGEQTNSIARLGLVADLKPYYEKYGWWKKQRPEFRDERLTQYILGLNMVSRRWAYRKDILRELGLEVPKTWDAFYTTTKNKVKGAGYGMLSLGNVAGWPGGEYFMVLLGVHATKQQGADICSWTMKDDPVKAVEVLKSKPVLDTYAHIYKLAQEKVFMDGVNAIDYGESRNIFTGKKSAFWQSGSWELAIMPPDVPDFDNTIGIWKFPPVVRSSVMWDIATGLNVPKYTQDNEPAKFEAIIDFLNKLTTPEYGKVTYKHGIFSNLEALNFDDVKAGAPNQLMIDWYRDVAEGETTLDYGSRTTKLIGMLGANLIQGLINMTITPEQAQKEFYEKNLEAAKEEAKMK